MTTEFLIALVGAGSAALGAFLTYSVSSRKVTVEAFSAAAAADLAKAQATDLMWENLTEAYRAAMNELQGLRAEVRELPALRAEVAGLSAQLAQFEAIVLTLPDEYRGRFAEVLAKRASRAERQSPKAVSGEG
jgi:hypothetical protein